MGGVRRAGPPVAAPAPAGTGTAGAPPDWAKAGGPQIALIELEGSPFSAHRRARRPIGRWWPTGCRPRPGRRTKALRGQGPVLPATSGPSVNGRCGWWWSPSGPMMGKGLSSWSSWPSTSKPWGTAWAPYRLCLPSGPLPGPGADGRRGGERALALGGAGPPRPGAGVGAGTNAGHPLGAPRGRRGCGPFLPQVLPLGSAVSGRAWVAWLAAVAFPLGAVLVSAAWGLRLGPGALRGLGPGDALLGLLLGTLISVGGGLLVAGLLSSREALLRLELFRGVKAMHLVPPLLAALALLSPNPWAIGSLISAAPGRTRAGPAPGRPGSPGRAGGGGALGFGSAGRLLRGADGE